MRWGWVALAVFLGATVGGYMYGRQGRLAAQRAAQSERVNALAASPAPVRREAVDPAELPSDNRSLPDSVPRLGPR